MTGAVQYKPCPNGCGRECHIRARMCQPCRTEQNRVERDRLADLDAYTQPHTRPLLLDYETHCMPCGRGKIDLQYTREHARLLIAAGLPPCSVCGGFVMLEQSQIAVTA